MKVKAMQVLNLMQKLVKHVSKSFRVRTKIYQQKRQQIKILRRKMKQKR